MSGVILGKVDDYPLLMTQEMRETHMHVLGNSRMGKSYFLEGLIRQDIENGDGVCVIDPHGELYDNLVAWLAVSRAGRNRRVHLINPSEDGWSVGFNPLCAQDVANSVRVDFMIDACLKVWREDVRTKPRLGKCLQLVFNALAEHGLSIAEARKFTDSRYEKERLRLTSNFKNWELQQDWNEFNSYPAREFKEYMESSVTRFMSFASKDRVQRIMGQTSNLLDFKECMEKQDIVLVNLAGKGKLSDVDSKAIGALLFADLFFSARNRDIKTAKNKPFYCYVDECADYITEDVAKALDQTAKFGLHYILAHHRMSQLRDYGEAFAEAIMTGAQSKVVFRVDRDEAAEELSKHLFRKEYNIERRKTRLTQPVVTGHELVGLRSHSVSDGETDSEGWSDTESSGSDYGNSENESIFEPEEGDSSGVTRGSGSSSGTSTSQAFTTSRSTSRNHAETHGTSETFKPIIEERGVPYTLEELVHEGTVKVRSLPKRTALVYLAGAPVTVKMKTTPIDRAYMLPSSLTHAVGRFVASSPYISSDSDIRASIEARRSFGGEDYVDIKGDDEDLFRVKTP